MGKKKLEKLLNIMLSYLSMKAGDTINYYTLLKEKPGYKWLCRCVCGKEKEVSKYNLASGESKSCGCHKGKKLGDLNRTHGQTYTRIYRIWSGMKKRCDNKNFQHYQYYGGRGITYHRPWKKFENFQKDMLPTYEPHLTLDRIDRNGNYTPKNCRWATVQEQMKNHGHCTLVTIDEETMSLADWCRKLDISYNTVMSRIRKQKLSPSLALLKQSNRKKRFSLKEKP